MFGSAWKSVSVNTDWMEVYVIHYECWCECKKVIDWSSCRDDYMWNPGACDFEYNNACKN